MLNLELTTGGGKRRLDMDQLVMVNLDSGAYGTLIITDTSDNERAQLHRYCDDNGLAHESATPSTSYERWLVIGRCRRMVWNKVRAIEGPIMKYEEEAVEELEESYPGSPVPSPEELLEEELPEEEPDNDELTMHEQQCSAVRAEARTSHIWDVTGHWRVRACPTQCPHHHLLITILFQSTSFARKNTLSSLIQLTSTCSRDGTPLPNRRLFDLSFHTTETPWSHPSGSKRKHDTPTSELWAKFSFEDVKGYMRFQHSDAITTTKRVGSGVYKLQEVDMPQSSNRQLHYRWRGRETGEDAIELDSDSTPQPLTFSNDGRKLFGELNTPNFGNWCLRGRKVRELSRNDVLEVRYFQGRWDNMNQETYDGENRDRWKQRW